MLNYPEEAKKIETLLEKATLTTIEEHRLDKFKKYLTELTICRNMITQEGSRRHLEVLLPKILSSAKKELGL